MALYNARVFWQQPLARRFRILASHLAVFVAGVIIATAMASHAGSGSRQGSGSNARRYAALDTFAQALSYVSNSYVDPVDERKLMYGAIRGMMSRLDQYSTFFPPRSYQQLREDTEGEFGGVGIALLWSSPESPEKPPPYLSVTSVIPGSPAARAGILPGDRVIAVDGSAVAVPPGHGKENGNADRSSVPAVPSVRADAWNARLRGPPGTRVTLELTRPSWDKARTIVLVREHIKVPTVEWLAASPGIGYIAIKKFHEATAADVEEALRALSKSGNGLSALILDLRGNPGGILAQAVRVADLFLAEGVIVTIRSGRSERIEREMAHQSGTWSHVRLAVLIDQDSASAAEIVAGALQDHKRAVVLGTPSFGKGSIQTFLDLTDGSGLKLTTGRYYTPLDRSLEHAGIIPDINVEAFEPEVIVAGSGGPDEAEEDLDDEHGSDSENNAGRVDSMDTRSLRERLQEDRQFETAHQTVRQWLGNQQTGTR